MCFHIFNRNFSDETSMGHPFMFTKTAKPPPGFCDGNNFQETLVDHNLVSQTNQGN